MVTEQLMQKDAWQLSYKKKPVTTASPLHKVHSDELMIWYTPLAGIYFMV
jgi:hypothetical protein